MCPQQSIAAPADGSEAAKPTFVFALAPGGEFRWVNISDSDDFIAAAPGLRPKFSRGAPLPRCLTTATPFDNGAKPHDAIFYLNKAEIGRPIGEVLSVLCRRALVLGGRTDSHHRTSRLNIASRLTSP
jgi:hypothetical protein